MGTHPPKISKCFIKNDVRVGTEDVTRVCPVSWTPILSLFFFSQVHGEEIQHHHILLIHTNASIHSHLIQKTVQA